MCERESGYEKAAATRGRPAPSREATMSGRSGASEAAREDGGSVEWIRGDARWRGAARGGARRRRAARGSEGRLGAARGGAAAGSSSHKAARGEAEAAVQGRVKRLHERKRGVRQSKAARGGMRHETGRSARWHETA